MNRPRSGEATSKGVAILNHFPQAIDPVMFAKAGAAREGRKGTSGAWQITHNNLFSGIAKCGVCGGRMKQEVVVRKGGNRRNGKNPDTVYQSKQDISYLKCHNALNHVADEATGQQRCPNRNWIRYEKLEQAVVQFAAGWLALHRQSAPSADVKALEVEIADARRFLEDKQRQADNAAISFTRTSSATMERLMLKLEAEVAEDQKAVQVLEERISSLRTQALSPDFLNHIEEQRVALYSEDDEERSAARVAMKQTLRRLIKSMECDTERETHVVIGNNALRLSFDNEGELIDQQTGQGVIFAGPDGEIDWHPDFPNADYQYAAE